MAAKAGRMVFVNLPVKDLKRSMEFFTKLGFEFNPQFTDERAACMIVNDQACVMLLSEPFFKTFTKRAIGTTSSHTEVLVAFSCASRQEVDDVVREAIAAGGAHAMDPVDHGMMYSWSFYDLDGHHWEPLWMDPAAIQK